MSMMRDISPSLYFSIDAMRRWTYIDRRGRRRRACGQIFAMSAFDVFRRAKDSASSFLRGVAERMRAPLARQVATGPS